MNLNDTFIVSSFQWNLISVSALDKFGFSCLYKSKIFCLFHDLNLVSYVSLLLNDNLCIIDFIASYNESFQLSSWEIKIKATNEYSESLWRRRLGNISKRRMKRLVYGRYLGPWMFTYLNVCAECINGKQTNQRRYDVNRSLDVLELIHTYICNTFSSPWVGQLYYTT